MQSSFYWGAEAALFRVIQVIGFMMCCVMANVQEVDMLVYPYIIR